MLELTFELHSFYIGINYIVINGLILWFKKTKLDFIFYLKKLGIISFFIRKKEEQQ